MKFSTDEVELYKSQSTQTTAAFRRLARRGLLGLSDTSNHPGTVMTRFISAPVRRTFLRNSFSLHRYAPAEYIRWPLTSASLLFGRPSNESNPHKLIVSSRFCDW